MGRLLCTHEYITVYTHTHTYTHEVIIIGNCVVFKCILRAVWETSMGTVVLG